MASFGSFVANTVTGRRPHRKTYNRALTEHRQTHPNSHHTPQQHQPATLRPPRYPSRLQQPRRHRPRIRAPQPTSPNNNHVRHSTNIHNPPPHPRSRQSQCPLHPPQLVRARRLQRLAIHRQPPHPIPRHNSQRSRELWRQFIPTPRV